MNQGGAEHRHDDKAAPPTTPGELERPASASSTRDAYNVVTDTVVGVNVRASDNKMQAICVGIGLVLGVGIGFLFGGGGGAILGAIGGMVVGVFCSGMYLMVYRARRHLRGKHD